MGVVESISEGLFSRTQVINDLDQIVERTLRQLANDPFVMNWSAKERDWVNYYAIAT